jgi:hypothetical protein
VALALLAAPPVAAGAADDLAVAVERKGDLFSVRARATLAAPVALVWQVLTDYETLPRFIPGISTSVVLARSADRVLLEQRGEARFLIFSFPIEVRYEVRESAPHWVESRAIAGNLRRMSGRYDLNAGAGRPGVRLDYTGEMEPDFELPPLVGAFALRSMVEEQFTAMVDEIERRAAPDR